MIIEKTYGINKQFNGYRMTKDNIISLVPLDTTNTDYQAIQKWIAEEGIVIDNAPSVTEAEGGEVIDNPPTE